MSAIIPLTCSPTLVASSSSPSFPSNRTSPWMRLGVSPVVSLRFNTSALPSMQTWNPELCITALLKLCQTFWYKRRWRHCGALIIKVKLIYDPSEKLFTALCMRAAHDKFLLLNSGWESWLLFIQCKLLWAATAFAWAKEFRQDCLSLSNSWEYYWGSVYNSHHSFLQPHFCNRYPVKIWI